MEQTKILAVMGSPSCGKTLTSLKLATAIGKQKKNVVIVTLDPCCPVIPYVLKSTIEHDVSIGELFTKMTLSQRDILGALVPVPENEYISILGYKLGESILTYPKVVASKIVDFMVMLQPLTDYIIIDCSTMIEADTATIVSLQMADTVLKLGTSNLKGISYFYTIDRLLADSKFNQFSHIVGISNLRVGQEWEMVSQQYGGVTYVIPYCEELEQQADELRLFENLTADESTLYNLEISKIVEGIFMIFDPVRETMKKSIKNKKEQKQFRNPFAKSKGEF